MALSTCCAVGHIISRRIGAAGGAAFYRRVAIPHGTASSTFCRYQQGKTDAAMMHRRLFHKPMCTPRRLRRLYLTCCRLPGADKVGFLPISAGKRRAPLCSAVDCFISQGVRVTGEASSPRHIVGSHEPAWSDFCRYWREKMDATMLCRRPNP